MKKQMIFSILLLLGSFSAQAGDAGLDGQYIVSLKIGDKVFEDQLEIKSDEPMIYYNREIYGIYKVPGEFVSSLKGTSYCHLWDDSCSLSFEIVAQENGRSYKVLFEAYGQVSYPPEKMVLEGTATLEDGQKLGTFKAVHQ